MIHESEIKNFLRLSTANPSISRKLHRRGYTLVEILVVLGITAIVGTAAVANLPVLFRSTKALDAVTDELVGRLVLAQQKAASQAQGAKWGVHLDATAAGGHFYKVFYGNSYAAGTVTDTVNIYPSIDFVTPAQGATADIIFEKVTGMPAVTHSIVLALSNDHSVARYISVISTTGLITKSDVAPVLALSVSLSPSSGTVAAGAGITTTATVSLTSGITEPASFSAGNLPLGVTASFGTVTCTPTCSTTLTLTTSPTTPVGSTAITVTSTSGSTVQSANFTLTVVSSSISASGYIWSDNIGWISLNCSNSSSCGTVNYAVTADYNSGLMSGYAWAANAGWISFTAADLAGCPSGTCEARITGGLSGAFPKTLTGWAKILSSDGWMHLSGTSQDASTYGVSLAADKTLSGYSWDSVLAGWTLWKGIAQDASAYGGQLNW